MKKTKAWILAGLLLGATTMIGCVEEQGPLEEAGEELDEAVDEVGDAVEDIGDGEE